MMNLVGVGNATVYFEGLWRVNGNKNCHSFCGLHYRCIDCLEICV